MPEMKVNNAYHRQIACSSIQSLRHLNVGGLVWGLTISLQ